MRASGSGPCARSWARSPSSPAPPRGSGATAPTGGEISEAPGNLLRDGRGKHHFRAGAPNDLWITDVTEFRIPAGKTYLSPIIDCFDGMPISRTISASPDAEMANPSLLGACSQLKAGEHPKGHSD